LSELESGTKSPGFESLGALAKAFDINRADLLPEKDDEHTNPFRDILDGTLLASFENKRSTQQIVNFITSAPDLSDAIMKAIYKVAETQGLESTFFFPVLLRTYQEKNNNYFKTLEEDAKRFLKDHRLERGIRINSSDLLKVLQEKFACQVQEEDLSQYKKLKYIRSIYIPGRDIFLVNKVLEDNQKAFEIGREIGRKYLGHSGERDLTTPPTEIRSFTQIWDEFQISYFAGALFMPQESFTADIREFFNCEKLDKRLLYDIMAKYNVSEEMILHRMTQIMSQEFGIKSLHFMRFQHRGDYRVSEPVLGGKVINEPVCHLTKYLNIKSMRVLYENNLHERYCRRWGALIALKNLIEDKEEKEVLREERYCIVQKSKFIGSDNRYICISLSRRMSIDGSIASITIGFPLDDHVKSVVKFWNDENIQEIDVGYTCERCKIDNCAERVARPTVDDRTNEIKEINGEIKKLMMAFQ